MLKGACSGAADAMGGERLDMLAMGVMEKAVPAGSSSCKATINPSWWAGKGMQFKPGSRSLREIRYIQKHTQLLVRKLPFSQ